MLKFTYIAKDQHGKTVTGLVEAADLNNAHEVLADKQLSVVSLKPKAELALLETINRLLNHVSAKDITFFSRQLAVMINATIPVVRSLKTLVHQTKNKVFQTIIADIASEVEGGAKLSQALGHYPKVFDQFFVHMVRAGETTGRLDQVLEYLAVQKEKDYGLRSKIIGALLYPAFILVSMVGIGIIMMVYVVPQLVQIIAQSGAKLPWQTQVLVSVSDFFVHDWWAVIIIAIVVPVVVTLYKRTPQGAYYFDWFKLKVPIFGNVYQKIALTRLAISLSNLLASGVPVTRSLEIVASIVDNVVYHDLLQTAIHEVENGGTIAGVFLRSKDLPSIVGQMMTVGEETGQLDSILRKLGEFYSNEVDNLLASIASVIEPLVIVLLGLGAGVMVTGILAPIYTVAGSLAQ